jgi:hypothetical protein
MEIETFSINSEVLQDDFLAATVSPGEEQQFQANSAVVVPPTVVDDDATQLAYLKYLASGSQTDFNALYELTDRRRKSSIGRAARFPRVDVAGLSAAADDALVLACSNYKLSSGVPFSAFLHLVTKTSINNYVRSICYTGKNHTIERPTLSDIAAVSESAVSYTPEEPIREFMDFLKLVDTTLYDVALAMMHGYDDQTIGRVIGRKESVDAAKSWTRRQRAKIAALLIEYQRD